MGREVAESCFDSLVMEMASADSSRRFADKLDLAARQIEAIGYQVGYQLSERPFPFPASSLSIFFLPIIYSLVKLIFKSFYSFLDICHNDIALSSLLCPLYACIDCCH